MTDIITLAMVSALVMPPKQYDHQPTEAYTIIETDEQTIYLACRQSRQAAIANQIRLYGCAQSQINVIFMHEDLSHDAYALVLRHEKAHLLGWHHD